MTTILSLRRDGQVAMAGDGQVTLDHVVMKEGARKVRRLRGGDVVAGFAGSAADAFSLFTRFEAKLDEFHGNLERASVELVREWRTDRALRRLEALLAVADSRKTLLLGGTGDLIEPDDGILAIGSGGSCALAAARALMKHTRLSAADVARESLQIAAGIGIYPKARIDVEVVGG